MQNYSPKTFFDLKNFPYRFLFDKIEYVWEVFIQLQEFLLQNPLGKIEATVEKGAFLINPEEISIGKGSVVEAGAYIVGPCLIGENCEIRNGAYLRGNILAGNHCIFGHTTEVKNSIFLSGVKAGHFSYIGDSILGNDVNLGAGTKCANLRLDEKMIRVKKDKEWIETKRRKLGAIVGDGVQTGCNSVLSPGTFMEKKSSCLPCTHVYGYVYANERVGALREKTYV